MNYRPTVAQINLNHLRHNIAAIRSVIGSDTALMAVVKADAYGHGIVPVARCAMNAGAQMLCVAITEEGVRLREAGIQAPVLVLGSATEAAAEAAVAYGLIQTVCAPETILAMERAAKKQTKTAEIHIQADTGMNRIGIQSKAQAQELLSTLADCPHIRLSGVYTHFTSADEPGPYTDEQLERFSPLTRHIQTIHPDILVHTSNSAGTFDHAGARFGGVRPGIALYGVAPSHTALKSAGLKPLMRWSTEICQINHLQPGDTVSYGRTFLAQTEMKTATLPVGYGDGYMRILSGRAHVLIGGQKAKVLGRVCMDLMMVDVTNIPSAAIGSEAVLIGRQNNAEVTAWDLADWAETIPYEILLSVSGRVPRVYVEDPQ